jgi:hypothetical protein
MMSDTLYHTQPKITSLPYLGWLGHTPIFIIFIFQFLHDFPHLNGLDINLFLIKILQMHNKNFISSLYQISLCVCVCVCVCVYIYSILHRIPLWNKTNSSTSNCSFFVYFFIKKAIKRKTNQFHYIVDKYLLLQSYSLYPEAEITSPLFH